MLALLFAARIDGRAMLLSRSSSFAVAPSLRLFSSTGNGNGSSNGSIEGRIDLLHDCLAARGISPSMLSEDNVEGVGSSALKTYMTYINPSPKKLETFLSHPPHVREQAAKRTSKQISMLIDQHAKAASPTFRNTDDESKVVQRSPLKLVLFDLRSAENVGQCIRTADGVGASVACVGITPTPQGSGAKKVRKASLGSEGYVDIGCYGGWDEFVKEGGLEGYWAVGMETVAGASNLWESALLPPNADARPSGTAVVLGNEATGIPEAVLAEMDAVVEIPMMGKKVSKSKAAQIASLSSNNSLTAAANRSALNTPPCVFFF